MALQESTRSSRAGERMAAEWWTWSALLAAGGQGRGLINLTENVWLKPFSMARI
jgi:hypothetical protein